MSKCFNHPFHSLQKFLGRKCHHLDLDVNTKPKCANLMGLKFAAAQGHWVQAPEELSFPLFHIKKKAKDPLRRCCWILHMAGGSTEASFMEHEEHPVRCSVSGGTTTLLSQKINKPKKSLPTLLPCPSAPFPFHAGIILAGLRKQQGSGCPRAGDAETPHDD